MLLESDILQAQSESKSAAQAARKCGVSYNTYKKWAQLYGIFDKLKNPTGKGIRKAYNLRRGKYALDDILAGKYPSYLSRVLRQRLIHSCYLEEKCSMCGFDEQRVSDVRVPLLLDFIDGDDKNFELVNLRLLCYNCFFLNVGNCVSGRFHG